MQLRPDRFLLGSDTGQRKHQEALIHGILYVMLIYFGGIGLLNVTLFDSYTIAIFDFIGFALSAAIFVFYRRVGHLLITSWAIIATVTFVLLLFVHISQAQNYSILWVTVVPPIAFFLLGPRVGTYVSLALLGYCAWYLYNLLQGEHPESLNLGAFLNFIEVATAHVFILRHYEKSRRDAYQQLQLTSITDPLTGVYNRLHLDNALKHLLLSAEHKRQPISVLLLDVDHFKRVNDQYGHLVGDEVLKGVGEVLREVMRETDLAGRWGGEEFLVISPNTEQAQAAALGERLLEAIRNKAAANDIHVTVSIGIATITPPVENASEQLLQIADKNLYRAKAEGRNRISDGC